MSSSYPAIASYRSRREALEQLAELGQQLLDLHTNYEEAEPYGLKRVDKPLEQPLPRLKRQKGTDSIEIDSATTLHGIPLEAWSYVLGTRSALEWVLDQYKEKKNDLPPIKGLQPYRFADHKEEAILLLQKVCTISVETTRLVASIDKFTLI